MQVSQSPLMPVTGTNCSGVAVSPPKLPPSRLLVTRPGRSESRAANGAMRLASMYIGVSHQRMSIG